MPLFLNTEQVYRLLQRELPEFVYPDGPPSAFFSTAENDAVANVAATGYGFMEKVYNNYWPQTCDIGAISSWEIKAFGFVQSSSMTLAERQDRVIQKLRTRLTISSDTMKGIVLSIIGTDKIVEISNWGCKQGSWILDDNQLGITTILGSGPRLQAVNPMACDLGPVFFGLTAEQWAGIQLDAYTYSVLIYGYVPTAAELAAINRQLSIYEPARSAHIIYYGLDPFDQIGVIYPIADGGDAFSGTYPFQVDGGDAVGTGIDVLDGGPG